MPKRRPYHANARYTIRVLACMAGALLTVTLLFRFWPPSTAGEPADLLYAVNGQEVINIEEILQTTQQLKKPPPPAPLPPIVVADDQVLDEDILELADNLIISDDYGVDEEVLEGDPNATTTASAGPQVQIGPKPVRFVEPEYTRAARRKKIRAEVVVEVTVDERGMVNDAKILEKFLLGDDNEPRQAVGTLGYGLEEAALSAAEKWRFRPARQNGKAVRSVTTLTFSFGV